MQILVAYPGDPESYMASEAARRMAPPSPCPICGCHRKLRLLGYYDRDVTTTVGKIARMKVRRFKCRECRLTVSLLPAFCLSYTLVRGESVARFLRGEGIDASDLPWHDLLIRCRKKFEAWAPELGELIQSAFGITLMGLSPKVVWTGIETHFGDWTIARGRILSACKVTMLGAYRCHTSRLGDSGGDHRHLPFSSGTDPPN